MKVFCIKTGCPEQATHGIKLNVPLKGIVTDLDQPFVGVLQQLKLCSKHADEVKLEHFPNHEKVFEKMIGQQRVDWSRAYFSKVLLDSEEYKAIMR
jgi:hypothetical protein